MIWRMNCDHYLVWQSCFSFWSFLDVWSHQEEVKEAREYFKKTENVVGALSRFPRYLTAERALVSASWIHAHCCSDFIFVDITSSMFHWIRFRGTHDFGPEGFTPRLQIWCRLVSWVLTANLSKARFEELFASYQHHSQNFTTDVCVIPLISFRQSCLLTPLFVTSCIYSQSKHS